MKINIKQFLSQEMMAYAKTIKEVTEKRNNLPFWRLIEFIRLSKVIKRCRIVSDCLAYEISHTSETQEEDLIDYLNVRYKWYKSLHHIFKANASAYWYNPIASIKCLYKSNIYDLWASYMHIIAIEKEKE